MHAASAVGITGWRQQHSAACVSDDGDDPEDGRDNLADMVPLNSNSTRTLWPVECINDWTGLCRHLSSHSQLPHCYGDCQKYEHTTLFLQQNIWRPWCLCTWMKSHVCLSTGVQSWRFIHTCSQPTANQCLCHSQQETCRRLAGVYKRTKLYVNKR